MKHILAIIALAITVTAIIYLANAPRTTPLPVSDPTATFKSDLSFEQHPMFPLLRNHGMTGEADPFWRERGLNKPIPPHSFRYAETSLPARKVYLLYKRHFNGHSKNTFNGRQWGHFDVADEADEPTGESAADALVFYSIRMWGEGGRVLSILVTRPSPESKTHVLVIEQFPRSSP